MAETTLSLRRNLSTREKFELRIAGLKSERKPFEADWEEISRLALPSRSEFLGNGKPGKRRSNTSSMDTAGRIAGRKVTNGMATGLSPSSRPWFKLALRDRDKMEFQPIKEWLGTVETIVYNFFNATNYYETTKVQYSELSHMGIGASLTLEHSEYVGVHHPLVVGQYWIGVDDGLRVSTLVRKTYPTVDQLVSSVRDWSKISPEAKRAYDKGDIYTIVPCTHIIERNADRFGEEMNISNKPWRSIKWEDGQRDKSILLSVGGYDSKPFTAPRWETLGDQVYCDSAPGFDALPDLRELQLAARRASRAQDMLVKPPLKAPAGLSRTGLSFDPGTINYVDVTSDNQVGPLFPTDYRSIEAIQNRQAWLTERVDQLFYADLFTAISDMEGVQPRNEQELLYRNEEKLTQLGPVVDRVNIEKLEVDIDRAFTICSNLGLIPPAPPDMDGEAMTVDFISMLAQAQRAAANQAIERAARFVGFIIGQFPEAGIKFDAEQAIDEWATNAGTSPKIIRSDEIVAQMREQMAQQQQMQQMQEMAPAVKDAAGAAELLSRTQVDPAGPSVLDRIMGA